MSEDKRLSSRENAPHQELIECKQLGPITSLNSISANEEKDSLDIVENSFSVSIPDEQIIGELALRYGSFDQADTNQLNVSSEELRLDLETLQKRKSASCMIIRLLLYLVLSICLIVDLTIIPIVYSNITINEEDKEHPIGYWRMLWIFNSFISIATLIVGLVGIYMEKTILITISCISLMLTLLVSDEGESVHHPKKAMFNIPLLVILFTSVLMIIYVAKLRGFTEDRLNLINKHTYQTYAKNFVREFM